MVTFSDILYIVSDLTGSSHDAITIAVGAGHQVIIGVPVDCPAMHRAAPQMMPPAQLAAMLRDSVDREVAARSALGYRYQVAWGPCWHVPTLDGPVPVPLSLLHADALADAMAVVESMHAIGMVAALPLNLDPESLDACLGAWSLALNEEHARRAAAGEPEHPFEPSPLAGVNCDRRPARAFAQAGESGPWDLLRRAVPSTTTRIKRYTSQAEVDRDFGRSSAEAERIRAAFPCTEGMPAAADERDGAPRAPDYAAIWERTRSR